MLLTGIVLGRLALPFFCKIFLNYPEKEDAIVYKGLLVAEGKTSCSGNTRRSLKICTPPNYFVVNNSIKHEIYFGLPGIRETEWLQDEGDQDIIAGTFWFHPIFGVIDQDVVYHTKKSYMREHDGKRTHFQYQKNRDAFEWYFDYKKHALNAIVFLVYLFFFYLYIKDIIKILKNYHRLRTGHKS